MIDSSAPPQVACMLGYTFDEFCTTTVYGDLLRSRYREVNIPAEVQQYLVEFRDWLNWVVVVEEDAPDSLTILPILQRMAEVAPRSSIYILSAEDDLSLVDSSLEEIDLGDENLLEADLPMLLFCNDEWQLLAQWGPRPRAVEQYLDGWLEQNPEFATLAESEDDAEQQAHANLLDKLTYEMRVWYISELDHECCNEIKTVMESIAVELDSNDLNEDDVETEADIMIPDRAYRPTVGFEQDEFSSDQTLPDAVETVERSGNNEQRSETVEQTQSGAAEKEKSSARNSRGNRSNKETRSKRNDRRSRSRSGNRRPRRSNRSSNQS